MNAKWKELKKDLVNIEGVATVIEEDDSKWGYRQGSKGYVVTDNHGNKWRIGPLFRVAKCPFESCVDAVVGKSKSQNKPNPTIHMTLMSLYYQYLYTNANERAHERLIAVLGHQKYRMVQRLQFSKRDNLPDSILKKEYERRFDAFEKIRNDARIGLFADKSTEGIMNYIDKRYGLPFMLNKDIAQTLTYSIHPDAFWPTAEELQGYVDRKIAEANAEHQSSGDPNSWTEIYGTH